MLHYILQTVIFQLLFLMVYDVFLKKETFFNWNRFYLLASAFLSVVLPFVKVDRFKEIIPQEYIFALPEVIIGKAEDALVKTEVLITNQPASEFIFNWQYLIYLGCAIALVLFTIKLVNLLVLAYKNPKTKLGKTLLVELINSTSAFSFFNYIFLGDAIKAEEKKVVLAHELEHVKQKHSLDLLFFEVFRILFWFNPLIYIYQTRIANLHEFIADSKAIKINSKESYYENLLAQVFDTKKVSFINPFFKQSLIKKRIIMLSKTKSKQINLVKYILLIPMVIGMLFYTSSEAQVKPKNETKNISEKESYDKSQKDLEVIKHKNSEIEKEEIIEETIIETENVKYANHSSGLKDEAISFAVIDQVPIYPGCDGSQDEKKCMSNHISKFVAQNFNTELGKTLGLTGRQKINVFFTINKEGDIVNIKTRAPHPELEKETRRVINMIPKLKAGEQDGKPVNVTFFLPVVFNVKGDALSTKNVENEPTNIKSISDISFSVVDQVPIYPGCDGNKDEKTCMSDNIIKFVAKNFNTKLAVALGLKGEQKINAFFTIDTKGYITNIKTRASHPELEKETRRVIDMIPKLKPGEEDGKPVNVTFYLPIKFKIAE